VVFDGRLHNRDEIISELRDRCDASAAASDAELAAASYQIDGTEFARRLLGDFAVAVVDARHRRVVLARDGMGIRPLYYRRTQSSVLFGSEIKTLIADPEYHARPNNQLLAELLLRRAHRRASDDATLFAGVSQVPPAHVAIFTAEGTSLHRYWDFDRHRPEGRQSFGPLESGDVRVVMTVTPVTKRPNAFLRWRSSIAPPSKATRGFSGKGCCVDICIAQRHAWTHYKVGDLSSNYNITC
jgi:asparagine synthetase B (glutamine-hydrolysing)